MKDTSPNQYASSVNTLNNEHQFSIQAGEKAFRILSTTLYENKIRAIVRELSCNAWDSHIQAGNTDQHLKSATMEQD